MKAILFDLDDTLYPEIKFIESGFNSVATYLQSRYHLNKNDIVSQMFEILKKNGRGKIFDTLLKNLGLYTEDKVQLLVYIYRSHVPSIKLYPDVLTVLKYLKNYGACLGIITDGMASVQKNKVSALNAQALFDLILYTDELGKEHWKPSTLPFKLALDLLQVSPDEAVYIGDNINKDFIAPNLLGMLTIRVDREAQTSAMPKINTSNNEAKFVVKEFKEIPKILLRSEK